MKLTWFAHCALRVHIGGFILVTDPDLAPEGVDRGELTGGADRIVALARIEAPFVDAARWRPRVLRPLDDTPPELLVHAIGPSALLVDAVGEPPLVLVSSQAPSPNFGRWADNAVVVLFGPGASVVATGVALLDAARPRLVALATDGSGLDHAFGALAPRLDGSGLVALEPGMAVEV